MQIHDTQRKSWHYFPCHKWIHGDVDLSSRMASCNGAESRLGTRQPYLDLSPPAPHGQTGVVESCKDESDGMTKVAVLLSEAPPAERMNCSIFIKTGDVSAAQTNSSVILTLFGDRGSTGAQPLHRSVRHKVPFRRAQLDEFKVVCRSVGKLSRVVIEPACSEASFDGWFLDWLRVTIKGAPSKPNGVPSSIETLFPSFQWLGHSCQAELNPSPHSPRLLHTPRKMRLEVVGDNSKMHEYSVSVYTADVDGAGTLGQVYLTLVGEHGRSTERGLHWYQSTNNRVPFQRAGHDTFELSTQDIGEVQQVLVRFEPYSQADEWLVDRIIVDLKLVVDQACSLFEAAMKFSSDCTTALLDKSAAAFVQRRYQLKTVTGTIKGAATTSAVSMQLVGEAGRTHWLKLVGCSSSKRLMFSTGSEDRFDFKLPDIGTLIAVDLRLAANL